MFLFKRVCSDIHNGGIISIIVISSENRILNYTPGIQLDINSGLVITQTILKRLLIWSGWVISGLFRYLIEIFTYFLFAFTFAFILIKANPER